MVGYDLVNYVGIFFEWGIILAENAGLYQQDHSWVHFRIDQVSKRDSVMCLHTPDYDERSNPR